MRTAWHSLTSFLRGLTQRHVTARGIFFVLVVLSLGIAAVISANNLLFLILAALLSTLLVSGFVSKLSLAGLELDIVLPEHVTARRKLAARLLVRNLKKMMSSFSVHVAGSARSVFSSAAYFPVIPSGRTLETNVEIYFSQRGLHREDTFEFSTSFPFGFLRRRVRVMLPREALVYPCIDPQPGFEGLLLAVGGDIEAHYRGRGHDFYRIRPYETFESARHLDWKASAHVGDLQLREFEREQEDLVEVYLDLDVPESHEGWFERAIECCGYLTWHLAERGARIVFRTQDFRISLPSEGDIYVVLKYLALVSPAKGKPPAEPEEENSFRLLFTAHPERTTGTGWGMARIVDPLVLPALDADIHSEPLKVDSGIIKR